MAIRIWHQSMTVLEERPGYARLLGEHIRKVCDEQTVVDLHGLTPGTYPLGVDPFELAGLAREHYLEQQIVENALRAEREGYDAFAMTCFSDPKLDLCRSLVSIPVLSAFETSLLTAATSAKKFGILVPDGAFRHFFRELATSYGFGQRIATVAGCSPALTETEIERGFGGDPALIERLYADMRSMARAGADIIIPAEGVLNAMLVQNDVSNVDGLPVFDAIGALFAHAEMMVKLQRRTGLRNSKSGAYRRPSPAMLRHLRSCAARALEEAAGLDT